MGVPSFYKWLVGKYPNIVVPAKEGDDSGEGRINGVYHNLYLDMNGIIHPCFHPEDQVQYYLQLQPVPRTSTVHTFPMCNTICDGPDLSIQVCPPTTFDEVFQAMFEYMDRLFRIVRPTKLLYLVADGVAPRAKMNQQRSRRFKAAKDAKDAVNLSLLTPPLWPQMMIFLHRVQNGLHQSSDLQEIQQQLLRERFRAEGKEVLPKETNEVSDPNVITPGTEFMEKLSKALEYHIRVRLNTDPGWNIKVILSDSNVPGEGEHKIMSSIRAQRSCENYDPNTRHCLYGLDADLIMLALASYEPHFSILREDVVFEVQPESCIPISKEFFKNEESSKKYRRWFPRTTEEKTTRSKVPKKSYAAYLKVSRLEKFFHELSLCEEKIFVKRYELREITGNTLELRRNLKDALRKKQDLIKTGASNVDRIRLGFAGWKSRFYREKFGIENYNEVAKLKGNMVQKYLEGLCWVLQYYFADVPSWNWYGENRPKIILLCICRYYPFHYAPYASDFKGLSQFKISFTKDKPLKPFDQLMAVLPAERQHLQIDTHGKRFLWQGIALLPFIDEKLLLSATKTVENNLAMHEMSRNTVRQEKIFLRNTNSLARSIQTSDPSSTKHPIDPSTRYMLELILKLTLSQTLTESDISRKPLWHTYPGYRPPVTISTMEAQPRISNFSRGRGSAVNVETPQQSSIGSSRGRGYTPRPFNTGGAYTPRPAGSGWAGRRQYGGGTFQTQQVAWRPVEHWSRGGTGGGRNGGGRGGSGQSRGRG
ncbi:hypothetical protein PR202_ga24735 [Eleusine coracana subsp. coracana]|uniref:Uncharacterized protein n=1 Tax=Eleusine coracana subsp. coracana TaxID=191504 RepID=A0AAV5D9K4_ELECO|nr:hypothetical protein PR202_ga24735 [Eleusine coracana subsp. coracana]